MDMRVQEKAPPNVIIAEAGSRYSPNPPTPAELMIPNTNMNNANNIPAKDAIST